MLIYNHAKEFIGINKEGLHLLGCANINELLNECYDFADLFVKRPGYIHNFKNFNWIDFIMHAEADESKAIVHIKSKTFSCQIEVNDFALVADPNNAAYSISLTHVKAVSSDESAKIAQEVSSTPRTVQKIVPEVAQSIAPEFDTNIFKEDSNETSDIPLIDEIEEQAFAPIEEETEDDSNVEYDPYDVPSSPSEDFKEQSFDPSTLVPDFDKPLEIEEDLYLDSEDANPLEILNEDGKLDIHFDDEEDEEPLILEEAAPMLGDYISNKDAEYIGNLKTDKNYIYDPNIAADELGLPVDLIEEFIEDFIQQAHEFNDELYESTAKEDYDNVKVLSHKLKGVAANLRIEDAFEVLSIVNTSNDREEVEANLKQLNRIIAKLEGKDPDSVISAIEPNPERAETPIEVATVEKAVEELEEEVDLPPIPSLDEDEDDDLYAFNIKEDTDTLEKEVPMEDLSDEDEDLYDFAPIETLMEEKEETTEEEVKPIDDEDADDDLYALDSLTEEPVIEEVSLHFDTSKAANELGIDSSIINELVQDFIMQAKDLKSDLDNAITDENFTALKNSAIILKGVSDNLRITEISEQLTELTNTQDVSKAKLALSNFYLYIDQL